ncbi:facilitated trehalose transporter Tret1-like [Sipha flava]|uniref:Facilitated trehalose transporter Tret1-like n=2 Tax=Sipha flava TaxID=143950 RepID=A0A8B8FCC2_9HEMI|nr:facilitated trehalose transporter Tret1-like [Sipha flava]
MFKFLQNTKHAELISRLKIIFCVFVICFAQLLIGCSYVFSSTLLAQLRKPTSTLKLNSEEASWIASISVLVCPVGLIITGVLTDRIGRKRAIQIVYIPMIISWLLLVFADSYEAILIARIIQGFPFGSSTCEYLYIAEISPTKLRSVFFSTVTLFVGLGIMTEWLLAMFFHWNALSAVLCAMSVAGFVMVLFVPESPMWLRAQGRVEEADRVDKWFGLKRADISVSASRPSNDIDVPYWSLYLQRAVWKPTLITSAFLFLQQWSGVYVLLFYSVDVFHDCNVQQDGTTLSLLLACARVTGGITFTFLHRLRRKTLMVISGVGASTSLFVVVVYTLIFRDVAHPPYGTVLATAFIAYMFFNLLGILPLPWILCGEVFPMTVKGTMNGAVQTWGYFIMFLIIKLYPSMVLKFGIEMSLSLFATICLINSLFGVFIMPETKGKSLDDILSYFVTRKKNGLNENL